MAAQKVKSCCSATFGLFSSVILEYDTAKIVHIKNWKVGLLNRLVQLVIVGYIVAYGIILEKGYQKFGPVAGIVTTKLKGASLYDGSHGDFYQNCNDSYENFTFDVADFVIPPQEPNSFFVMTNLWRTCGQKQGICAEASGVVNTLCNPQEVAHANCTKGVVKEAGNGPLTGNCVQVGADPTKGQCEMRGWCPVEEEVKEITHSGPKINASEFTVLVKNSIEYPTVKKGNRKRNILPDAPKTFLQSCKFSRKDKNSTYCPIFSLAAIVDMIPPDKHGNKTNFTKLSTEGGVVGLEIQWDCDHLERGLDHCDPKYSAKRLDDATVSLSPGYNFRFAKYYLDDSDGEQIRTLYKAYGILFKVEVTGTGGRFDFVTFILKVGSMIALLGIATVVSDVIVLYILGKGGYYRKKKYLNVNEPINEKSYDIIEDEDKSIGDSAGGPPNYGSTHFDQKK